MISKNIVKQPKSLVEVTITAPWTDIQATWDQTLTRMSAEVEIAGFRKGAAPINMVEGQLGAKLQDEVLKQAMPNLLIEGLKGTDIVPIDYPKYDLVSFVKGTQLQFKATITNRPAVSIGAYKTIKATRPILKSVNDEEVQKVIDDLYKRWKARQPVASLPSGGPQPSAGSGSLNFQGNGQSQGPDDTFAKAMGALSISDLKDKARKDLEANVKYNNELDYEEAILQEVEKNNHS